MPVDFGPFLLLALMEGLVTAAVLALTASGLSLVFGVMRVVNVAHGEFFMLGAVLAWFVSQWVPGPPAVAFAVALVICPLIVGGIAAVADMLVLKRLNYDPEATIVATIGLLYILQQAALERLTAPMRARSRRRSTCASSCRGSAIPATSSPWSSRRSSCFWRSG